MEEMRSQMRKQSSSDVSNSRKPQSTLGGRDKRRKRGSQSPGRVGSLGKSQNGGMCACAKEERQPRERVKHTWFFCVPVSQSPAGNYHWLKLTRNWPTGKPSKGSPEKSALLPEQRHCHCWDQGHVHLILEHYRIFLTIPLNLQPVSLQFILYICNSDVDEFQIYMSSPHLYPWMTSCWL